MPLVTCPDCGKSISDAAPTCIGCGRPMHATAASGTSRASGATPATAALRELFKTAPRSGHACPKCGGDLVAFRALHEAGGAAAPSYVAPPDPTAVPPMSMAGCTGALFGALAVASFVWFQASPLWAILSFFVALKLFGMLARARARPTVEARVRDATERWENRFLCTRCGARAIRDASGSIRIEDADADVDALLRAGQKIEAIKLVRERTGVGLKEAKDIVDAREKEL